MSKKMKPSLFIFLILFSTPGFSQSKADIECAKSDTTIKVYIQGSVGGLIDKGAVEKGFRIRLADTSYSVISFHLSYMDNEEIIYSISTAGDTMTSNEKTLYLKNISKSDFIVIDRIMVTKEGVCTKAKSFICYISK